MLTSDTTTNTLDHTQQIGSIIRSNQAIRQHVQLAVNDFLKVRKKLLDALKTHRLDQIDQLKPFAETMNIQTLNKQVTSEKVQLALCGENSSGKTSFLHTLLEIGDVLPSGVGPVTARIIKLTYADAKDACINIFKSFEDSLQGSKSAVLQKIDLSSFFVSNGQTESDDENSLNDVDWIGIMDVLKEHVQRPTDKDVMSNDFAEWARHFVEIRLPSPTLQWNIDVYDTPGFLFDDAPVLKEILGNLVSRVHPTLVFLYDNTTTSDDMNNCYLAMKSALKQCDSSSIFYLNTKADIDHMPNVTDKTTMEQFQKILAEQRATRYDLLRAAPCLGKDNLSGLPKSVDECNCFDICSVISHGDELGAFMNNCAIRRLIQFVANSDLVVAKRITSLVLPAIEAFFDLATIISHRTLDQLQQLRRDALNWHDTYFSEHRKHFDAFLTNVYTLIRNQLRIKQDKLIRDAAKRKDKRSIESYMRLAIKHEVTKQVLSDTLSEVVSTILKMLLSNRDLMVNASSNELLVAALRTEEREMFETIIDESAVQATVAYYMLNNITTSTMLVAQILFSDDDSESDNESIMGLLKQLQKARSISREKNSRKRREITDHMYEAQQCLSEIESEMADEKSVLEIIIGLWSDQHKKKLTEKINELYRGAEKILPLRNKAHELIQQYASSFARIRCHLHAAQDFAKFDGIEPVIENDDSQSTVYSTHRARWGKKEDLLVKRLRRPIVGKSDVIYFEGQYHLKVRSLNIPYIADICYLYEKILPDGSRELWMFFPTIKKSLKDFIEEPDQKLSLDTAFEMMIRIATALACLHQNELVHRNVTASNIIFDDNNRVHLADFGDWDDDEKCGITNRHDPFATQNGTNDDIRAFGQLGLDLVPLIERSVIEKVQQTRLDSFKNIMLQCTSATANEPMSARTVKITLENI